jgi:MFS family permease
MSRLRHAFPLTGDRLGGRLVTPENKKWWTLAAVSLGLFMIMLDATVVNVALPAIGDSLHMKLAGLEWVVAGYALTFAAFMLTGGKLADLLGRRLVFMAGLTVFADASLACGLAPNGAVLIGGRAVQGVGAALMNPATLSIITATFPPRQRGTAIGIWAGVSSLALSIGPLAGGLLTEHANWNWIFFINVPAGLAALLLAPVLIEESRDTSAGQGLDLPGLTTSGVGLFALTYGFIEANTYGWPPPRSSVPWCWRFGVSAPGGWVGLGPAPASRRGDHQCPAGACVSSRCQRMILNPYLMAASSLAGSSLPSGPFGMATNRPAIGLAAVMTASSRSISPASPTISGRASTSLPRSRMRSGRPSARLSFQLPPPGVSSTVPSRT